MTVGPMSLSSRPLKLAIVVVAAVGAILSAAASARADASVSVSFHGHLRGTAYFEGLSDFKVCDRRKDGLPVAVRYSYFSSDGPVRRTQWHTAGVEGSGRPRIPGQFEFGCSYGAAPLIGDARVVWLQACVKHKGGFLQCSKVQRTKGLQG